MKLILLAGRIGSGKDTVADHLVERGAVKIALADKLKIVTQKLINIFYNENIPLTDFYDREAKERDRGGYTIRHLLQQVGSEVFRETLHENIWCETLNIPDAAVVIITDCRRQNEIDYFKKRYPDVVSIRLVRSTCIISTHQSEAYIDELNTDYVIYNNDTKEELYKKIKFLYPA